MAKKSKVEVTLNDGAKDVKKTLTYANDQSTNTDLAKFASTVFGLSNDTITNITRVDREIITDAEE